ncbi:hypothetical protein [Thalassospira sp. HJ]|uniref:hypothetical protein n=1 Tax=Thalassospira sp. HJ TaxID=1616823 RepID=UPI000ACBD694|nr:hypothetical protein [Thalassospira sp. HJ]
MAEQIELLIDDLLLDQNNPRLDPVENQSAALEALIGLNHEHIRNLMIDIKENGLDPGDSLYVMKNENDTNDYVVLDGNRRSSALIILSNSNVLDGTGISASVKKSLKGVAKGFDCATVEPLRAVLFENRDEANLWISRRHEGEDKGRGRINWGTLEKQRFSGDGSTLDVIEFIIKNAASDEEGKEIRNLLKRNSTTLTRLLESSPGRQHLGIVVKRDGEEVIPSTIYNPKWILRVLQKVVDDIKKKQINTRKLNKEKDIEDYLEGLPKTLQPSGQTMGKPHSFREMIVGSGENKGGATKTASVKSKRLPQDRSTLAPKKNPFKHPESEKARQLLKEAGNISVQNYRVSSAFLLRAFIEYTVDKYIDDNSLPKVDRKSGRELTLRQKAESAANHIEQNTKGMKKQLSGFRKLINGNGSPISIESLNASVHQNSEIPAADALVGGWEKAVPLFITTFGEP